MSQPPSCQPPRAHALKIILTTVLTSLALMLTAWVPLQAADEAKSASTIEIRPGDHICIIGNTLADRMQHDGWLETYLHSRFPKHDLVIRNLGFSGDELTLRLALGRTSAARQWLTRATKADVVFAFFGYNESFAGQEGLDKFKKDLDDFIKHTLGQKYNGKSAPRLVLFSPIAHENLHDRNLPDGSENNERLELYTAAMAEVAKANHVPFVDLFQPTLRAVRQGRRAADHQRRPPERARQRARSPSVIDQALFPDEPGPKRDPQALEKLRQAVLDKNFYWFNRYRTVDGYSIYGGRADLKFVDGQTNREVMQREMEVLDVMTANRDQRIWAVAQGGDLKVDDSNTPPFIPVKTNKPGQGPERRAHLPRRRGGHQADDRRQGDEGQPVRLREGIPRAGQAGADVVRHQGPAVGGRLAELSALEAQGGDERQAPDPRRHQRRRQGRQVHGLRRPPALPDRLRVLQRRRARRPGARPDVPEGHRRRRQGRRPQSACSTASTRPTRTTPPTASRSTRAGRSTSRRARSTTPRSRRPTVRRVRNVNAGVFRYEPRTQKFEVYVTFGFANPHGHVFDRWGQDIVIDGTGANPYHAAALLRPPGLPREARRTRRRSTSSGPGPAPASRSSPAGTSPRRTRATCWWPT